MEAQNPQSFTFGNRIDRTFNEVTGMVVDKDDNLILADQSFLLMYSQNGEYIKEYKLNGDAWDISYHKKTGIIVVALKSKGIQFVDNFTAPQVWTFVQNMADCRGVTWVDDNVYVGGGDGHGGSMITILDNHGSYISSFSSKTSFIYYLHHRDNSILYTDDVNFGCMRTDGSNIFTVNYPVDLQWTRGIDTDRPGNGYVAALGTNNIVRLSPRGQNRKIVLKQEDGIEKPYTLCFSRDYKKLFVSNIHGTCVDVYNCHY